MGDPFWPLMLVALPVGFVWGITANYLLKAKGFLALGVATSMQFLAFILVAIVVFEAPKGIHA